MELKEIENKLYNAIYVNKDILDYNNLWNEVKNNIDILKEAITIEKGKNRDTFKGIIICNLILMNIEDIPAEIYDELVRKIYHNKNLARTVVDGNVYGGTSFLLMTLKNHNLELSNYQKYFVEEEAKNKIGTRDYEKKVQNKSLELDLKGISDKTKTTIKIGNKEQEIGLKSKFLLLDSILTKLSDTQVHGTEENDIRYEILNNPNWTYEEKKTLAREFFYDESEYIKQIEKLESIKELELIS